MYPKSKFFTSGSVTEKYPDTLCNQISDALLGSRSCSSSSASTPSS
jgi:S-adenosylmethionine synthetase